MSAARNPRAVAWIALALAVAVALGARPAAAQITQEMQDYCDAVRACQPPPPRPPGPPPFDPQRWGWIPIDIWPTTPPAVRDQLAQHYGCARGPDGRYYFPQYTPVWRFEMGTRPPFTPAPSGGGFDPEHFPTNPPRCYACLGGTGDAIRLWIAQGRRPASFDNCTLGTLAGRGPVYFDPAIILASCDAGDPTGPRPMNEAHPYPSVVCVPRQPPATGSPPGGGGSRFCLPRVPPTWGLNASRFGSCAPDVINNGMMGYQCGSQLGGGLVGAVTDDPNLIAGGQIAGGTWGGACLAEGAMTQATGYYLPAQYSPLYQTGRCASGGGRLLVQGGRACASNPLTYVVAAGAYLDYQAYQYSCAVDDLTSMNDLSGVSEDEFEAMIPYNICSGAYWRNVGAYYGLCDPLPPPRTMLRGRPRGVRCGGEVRAQNVDPPYEESAGGGCATGSTSGGGLSLGAIAVVLIAGRRRRRRARASEPVAPRGSSQGLPPRRDRPASASRRRT